MIYQSSWIYYVHVYALLSEYITYEVTHGHTSGTDCLLENHYDIEPDNIGLATKRNQL